MRYLVLSLKKQDFVWHGIIVMVWFSKVVPTMELVTDVGSGVKSNFSVEVSTKNYDQAEQVFIFVQLDLS